MLKELIDKFYLDRERSKEQSHFYITDAGKCSRAVFFKFKNVPREDLKANILRLFDHGDHIHQLIMESLFGTRDIHVVAAEVNIPPQEIISGRADAIVSCGKQLYVLDIKSMNSMIFRSLTAPKEENICQLQLYLHYFKIKNGILLYVNKDNQELKEFIVKYNKVLVNNLIAGFKDLDKKIKTNVIPNRLGDYPGNYQCRFCQFKEVCGMTNGGEIKWAKFRERMESLREEV